MPNTQTSFQQNPKTFPHLTLDKQTVLYFDLPSPCQNNHNRQPIKQLDAVSCPLPLAEKKVAPPMTKHEERTHAQQNRRSQPISSRRLRTRPISNRRQRARRTSGRIKTNFKKAQKKSTITPIRRKIGHKSENRQKSTKKHLIFLRTIVSTKNLRNHAGPKILSFDGNVDVNGRVLIKSRPSYFQELRVETMSDPTPPRGRGRDRTRGGAYRTSHGSDRSRSSRSSLESTPTRGRPRSTVHRVEAPAEDVPETPQRQQELELVREELRQAGRFRHCVFLDELRQMSPPDMMHAYSQVRDTVLSERLDYGEPQPHDPRSREDRRKARDRAKNRDIRRISMLASDADVTIIMANCHPFLLRRWIDYANTNPHVSVRIPPVPRDEQNFANQEFYRRLNDYTETRSTPGAEGTGGRLEVNPSSGASTSVLNMLMQEHPNREAADLRRYLDVKTHMDQIGERERTIFSLRQKLAEAREQRLQEEQARVIPEAKPLMLEASTQTHLGGGRLGWDTSCAFGSYDSSYAKELKSMVQNVSVMRVVTPRTTAQTAEAGVLAQPAHTTREATIPRPPLATTGPSRAPTPHPSISGVRQIRPILGEYVASPPSSPEVQPRDYPAAARRPPSAATTARLTVSVTDPTPPRSEGGEPMVVDQPTEEELPPRLPLDDPRRITTTPGGQRVVVITHSEEERLDAEEAEAEEERLFRRALRTGVPQTPMNQPYQGPRRRRSKSSKAVARGPPKEEAREDIKLETEKRRLSAGRDVEVDETVVKLEDPAKMDIFVKEQKVPRRCPDALDGRVMYSVPEVTRRIPSHCNYPMCAIRNPGFTYEEHENAEMKFTRWTLQEVMERAVMSSGPFIMMRRRKMQTVNFGYQNCMSWKLVEKQLEKHRFFETIEETGIVAMDLEHWPDADAKRKLLTKEEKARAISVITFMDYNGTLLQWGLRYDGRNDPVAPIPERLSRLIGDSAVFKIGFGALGDFDRLVASRLFTTVTPGCDMANLVLFMFPQKYRPAEKIRTGKTYAAAKLDAKWIFTKDPVKPMEEKFEVWKMNYHEDFRDWKKPIEMTAYNHMDNRAAWATLMAATARHAQLTHRPDGDVLRVAHFILAGLRGAMSRMDYGDQLDSHLRPYSEWFTQDTAPQAGGARTAVIPYLLRYDWVVTQVPTRITKIMNNLRRGYEIDWQALSQEDKNAIAQHIGKPAENLNYAELFAKTIMKGEGDLIFPHVCYRCGGGNHDGSECPTDTLTCIYCHNIGHVVTVCPVLHGRCETCNAFGHLPEDHAQHDMVKLYNRFHAFKALGFLTVRLATREDAVGYVGTGANERMEWIPREMARARHEAHIERQHQTAPVQDQDDVMQEIEEVLRSPTTKPPE